MTGPQRSTRDQLEELTDEELLRVWSDGNRDGLAELVARHHGWVLRTVKYLSFGERDAEAIAQEVWLDVMTGARSYRGSGSFRSWIETILRHRITSTWRSRLARPQILVEEVPETLAGGPDIGGTAEVRDRVRGVLATIPVDQRDAVWCVDVLGLSVAEAGQALGVPPGTIKSRCSRGREKLRLALGDQD